jgi:hypothetical protein
MKIWLIAEWNSEPAVGQRFLAPCGAGPEGCGWLQ